MPFEITKPLSEHIGEAKESVNKLASDKILARYSIGKQSTLNARAISGNTTPEYEQAWAWIESVIAASNATNAEMDKAKTVADIRAAEQSFKALLNTL